jgi:hypothetical protein
MNDKLGEKLTPLGAPEINPDVVEWRAGLLNGRPRLGGSLTPIEFSAAQKAVIEAVADTMIPPGDGFPAPSAVGIVDFIGRYVAPAGAEAKYYPFAGEAAFKAGLDRLGDGFASANENERVKTLRQLESDDEAYFSQLRSLVYYGYYAATEVTLAIQKQIPAGRDYHGPPLPYGYINCIDDWDEEALSAAGRGSGYIATDQVKRVDLSKVEWLQRRNAQ